MESSEADLLAPRFQRKRLKTEQIGRVSKRFIWSNLCTRHIPKQLTPHGYGDWPDKRATRIEIPLMTCRTKNDKRLICCDPAGLIRASVPGRSRPLPARRSFWEIETLCLGRGDFALEEDGVAQTTQYFSYGRICR
jgi:hypothetical protein